MAMQRAKMMRDRFDYETYWWILDHLAATNRLVRFADLLVGFPTTPFCIIRHDVDYSPAAALRLAEQESNGGIRATYFLLLNSIYYNLLSPAHATFARDLVAMGHEVGLHYDMNFLEAFPREAWCDLIHVQAGLLGELSGKKVTTIAMHQPGLYGDDPLRNTGDFLNAYDDRFYRDMPYVSDSCRAWWDHAWEMFSAGNTPSRLQLALHPINWDECDRDRETIFSSLHSDLARSIELAGGELLEKIASHKGVLQHVARNERG